MKTLVAAMVVASVEFVRAHRRMPGAVALLITAATKRPVGRWHRALVQALRARGEKLDCCIVGEPTSVNGGRHDEEWARGSLSCRLTVRGVQGHVAYPQLARNPIHQLAPALAELAATEWDRGNAHFPATTFQVSNIHGGTGALNVIPGAVVVDFNFRFSTESTPESLKTRVHSVLDRHGLTFEAAWSQGGEPFLTTPGTLSEALTAAIRAECGVTPVLSTTGGTSDGRYIAKICPQVVEFGPVNETIHKIDENVIVADIEPLKNVYRRTLEALLK